MPETKYRIPWCHKRTGQYTLKIGKDRTEKGLVHKWFYFGMDFATATIAAVKKQKEWEAIENDWPRIRAMMEEVEPFEDWTKPFWVDREQIIKDRADYDQEMGEALKVEAEYKAKDLANEMAEVATFSSKELVHDHLRQVGILKAHPSFQPVKPTTILEAKEKYLQERRKDIGLVGGKGITPQTYNGLCRDLTLALGQSTAKHKPLIEDRNPIDIHKPVHLITADDLKTFVQFWCALPEGVKSERTAVNRCKIFKALLDWCVIQSFGFVMPPESKKIFEFRNVSTTTKIVPYNPIELAHLLNSAGERVRLFILLGLNCAYYQQDIADLRPEDLVTHEGRQCLFRRRSKTKHQNAFQTCHYLWPETLRLLKKYMAPTDNPYGLLLLNNKGEPLQFEEVDNSKKDSLNKAYLRACEKAGIYLQFKQLRKIGYNQIKRITQSRELAKMYNGQVIPGVDKVYDLADYEPLILALAKWREQLKKDRVL